MKYTDDQKKIVAYWETLGISSDFINSNDLVQDLIDSHRRIRDDLDTFRNIQSTLATIRPYWLGNLLWKFLTKER